jgi:Aspartyl/Asparaginyl beta-hydroxylase
MKFILTDPWDSEEKPWQTETKKYNLELVKKLNTTFDSVKLFEDYQSIISNYKTTAHTTDSAWKGISLVSSTGATSDIVLFPGQYKETLAIKSTPYIKSIIDSLECEKKRVRLMQLLPGHTLNWHIDKVETGGCYITRFHIPIITNDNVLSQVSHSSYFFGPGEFGFIDTAFPHRVGNLGTEVRIHLIIELVLNNFVQNLINIDLKDVERRRARSSCAIMLNNFR